MTKYVVETWTPGPPGTDAWQPVAEDPDRDTAITTMTARAVEHADEYNAWGWCRLRVVARP